MNISIPFLLPFAFSTKSCRAGQRPKVKNLLNSVKTLIFTVADKTVQQRNHQQSFSFCHFPVQTSYEWIIIVFILVFKSLFSALSFFSPSKLSFKSLSAPLSGNNFSSLPRCFLAHVTLWVSVQGSRVTSSSGLFFEASLKIQFFIYFVLGP